MKSEASSAHEQDMPAAGTRVVVLDDAANRTRPDVELPRD